MTLEKPDASSNRRPVTMAIIADGIGGHQAGELASAKCVQVAKDRFASESVSEPVTFLRNTLEIANQQIYDFSQGDDQRRGMGTTATAVIIADNKLYVANVGDSRVYLIRNREAKALTIDHTWAREAVAAGRLSLEQARRHPNRNVIKRYL